MKYITLLILLTFSSNLSAAEDKQKIAAVMSIVNTYLLSDVVPLIQEPEFSDPEDCTVPYIAPRPGFGVKGQCGARGLKAAALDRRALAFFNSTRPTQDGFPTNKEKACQAVRNYNFCGFITTTDGRVCNALARNIRRNGDFAANILKDECESIKP